MVKATSSIVVAALLVAPSLAVPMHNDFYERELAEQDLYARNGLVTGALHVGRSFAEHEIKHHHSHHPHHIPDVTSNGDQNQPREYQELYVRHHPGQEPHLHPHGEEHHHLHRTPVSVPSQDDSQPQQQSRREYVPLYRRHNTQGHDQSGLHHHHHPSDSPEHHHMQHSHHHPMANQNSDPNATPPEGSGLRRRGLDDPTPGPDQPAHENHHSQAGAYPHAHAHSASHALSGQPQHAHSHHANGGNPHDVGHRIFDAVHGHSHPHPPAHLSERDLEELDLYERDLEFLDELYARAYDETLYEREFDEEELSAREFFDLEELD